MPVEHFCLSCSKTFATISGLRSHSKAKKHTANPFICDACELSFSSLMALESHMNSRRHANDSMDDYTSAAFMDGRDDSDAGFSDSDSDIDNDSDSDIDNDPYCNGCERQFINTVALNQHLFASVKHNWCFECSRDFKSETALLQHQNSLAHRGYDFKCPFCEGMFKSPSGIALHIESGCHKITRHQVTAGVHKMNIIPNISVKRIKGLARPTPTIDTFIATEASFNGSAYECYICRKSFRTLSGLNGHLNSPAHDDDEFRCPKCKTEFKLISGFIQHLESNSCNFAKATQIDDYFKDLTGQFSHLLKL